MKKSLFNKTTIALAIGLVSAAANAYVVGPAGAPAVNGVPAATDLVINAGGQGHMLLVPYYTAQGGNRSYLTLVNTDMRNGKVMKIRFRGASNSDDVLDFTLFLSPGDAWTAVVVATDASLPGTLHVVEGDTSCTVPNIPVTGTGVPFRTFRLSPALNAATQASETREGYIEIFTQADVPPSTTAITATGGVYQSIEHVSGMPRARASAGVACSSAALDALQAASLNTSYAGAQALGLEVPTTGVTASWAIAKIDTGRSWSGNAVAVEAQATVGGVAVPGYGNIVFHPQTGSPELTLAQVRDRTADPLLRGGVTNNAGAFAANTPPAIPPLPVDLPDMSTPYLNSGLALLALGEATKRQAQNLTQALATYSVTNEYLTVPGAVTDWTFTMPTRRYNVVRDYALNRTLYSDWRFNDAGAALPALGGYAPGANYFAPFTTDFTVGNVVSDTSAGKAHVLCVGGISVSGGAKGSAAAEGPNRNSGVLANRDEGFAAVAGPGVDFSPAPPPGAPAVFCGEAGVFAYNVTNLSNGSGVLQSTVATRGLGTTISGTQSPFGWQRFGTPGLTAPAGFPGGAATLGLPVIGFSFFTYQPPGLPFSVSVALPHRTTYRP